MERQEAPLSSSSGPSPWQSKAQLPTSGPSEPLWTAAGGTLGPDPNPPHRAGQEPPTSSCTPPPAAGARPAPRPSEDRQDRGRGDLRPPSGQRALQYPPTGPDKSHRPPPARHHRRRRPPRSPALRRPPGPGPGGPSPTKRPAGPPVPAHRTGQEPSTSSCTPPPAAAPAPLPGLRRPPGPWPGGTLGREAASGRCSARALGVNPEKPRFFGRGGPRSPPQKITNTRAKAAVSVTADGRSRSSLR